MKKKVNDKNIYKTTLDEKKLIEPENIQAKLDEIMMKYNCFTFVRPSGTEDIVRIYIEGNCNNDIQNEILELLY